jgi:hypothetical protein
VPPAKGTAHFGRTVCADPKALASDDFCVHGSAWPKHYDWQRVDDPDGPFDGWSYIKRAALTIRLEALLNGWIFEDSPAPARDVPNYYTRNSTDLSGAPVNWAQQILESSRTHERSGFPGVRHSGHFRSIQEGLDTPGGDPIRYLEALVVAHYDSADDHAAIDCLDHIETASGNYSKDPLVVPAGVFPAVNWGWLDTESRWAAVPDAADPDGERDYAPATCVTP